MVVASRVALDARATYATGPLENTGPFPPRVEEPTTYTVVWTVSNTSNDLSDTKVSAALPSYVEWVGLVSPSTESVSFNNVGGEVVWQVGTVSAGSGHNRPAREVAFQVRLVPSISQVGMSPVLIGAPTLTAHDVFTGTTRRAVSRELTTAVSSDPGYRSDDGKVTQ